jgi:transcriptional regulator with XRE-family HTH domain
MLKTLREAKGLTQDQLAKKAGVTEAYVSMLESGKRKAPSLPALQRLAKALGAPVAELLG